MHIEAARTGALLCPHVFSPYGAAKRWRTSKIKTLYYACSACEGQGHLYRVEPRVPDDVTLRDPSLLSSTCNETLSVKSSFHVYTGQPLFIPRGSHRSQRRYRVPRVPRVPRYVVPGWNDRPDDDNGTQTCYSDDELLHDDYDAQCYYEERKTPRAKQRYHNTRCRKRATRIKNTNKLVRRKVSKKRDYCRCRRQRIHKWLLDTH